MYVCVCACVRVCVCVCVYVYVLKSCECVYVSKCVNGTLHPCTKLHIIEMNLDSILISRMSTHSQPRTVSSHLEIIMSSHLEILISRFLRVYGMH